MVVIVVATLIFGVASMWFNLGEWLQSVTQPNEHYEIDELPGLLVFIALAIALFAWRRMLELRDELARRREAERGLKAALDGNRRLAREIVRIQEDERRSLARELHDEFGQYLNAIKIDAVGIRQSARSDAMHDFADSIIGLADHVQDTMRETIARLRPAGLDELGLSAALEHCVAGWRKRLPTVAFEYTPPASGGAWPEETNIALYRVVQEALTNVAKHADAARVVITLDGPQAGADGEIRLTVTNDGTPRGGSRGTGLGIVGMRERVEALNGRLEASAGEAGGFRLEATIPLHRAQGGPP